MANITIKAKVITKKNFTTALATFRAENVPVNVIKQTRRITKKILEEYESLTEDAEEFQKKAFGVDFTTEELKQVIPESDADREKIFEKLKWPVEKVVLFKEKYKEFDRMCQELGETECEIPFPKIVLPSDFKFRSDYADILEDILDLD